MLLKSLEVGQARKEGRKKPRFIYSGSSLSVIFPPAKIDQFAFVVDVQLLPPPPLLDTFSKLSTVMHFPSLSLFLRVFSLRCSFPLFFSGGGEKKKAPRNDFETIPGSSVRSSRKPSNFSSPGSFCFEHKGYRPGLLKRLIYEAK